MIWLWWPHFFQWAAGLVTILVLAETANAKCISSFFSVSGYSLAPMIKEGQSVKGCLGDCVIRPRRGDLILFKHLGAKLPILKIVFGVAGDHFNLKKTANGWNLLINGKLAKNSEKIPYKFSSGNEQILRLYLNGTKGLIPPSRWLVLGDRPTGTDDSSRFGLIQQQNILGVVYRNRKATQQEQCLEQKKRSF